MGKKEPKPTIKKMLREKPLDKMCSICAKCTDMSKCNNREGTVKCELCIKCDKVCLKSKTSCDRFRCYPVFHEFATVNGEQKLIACGKDSDEVKQEKNRTLVDIDEGAYIDKNNITLLEMLYISENKKHKLKKTKDSSFIRNYETIENIAKDDIAYLKVQKIKKGQLEDFIASRLYLSQSVVNKIYDVLNTAFKRAVEDKIVSERNNPMKDISRTVTDTIPKDVTAFEIEEQNQILDYISSNEFIIKPNNKADKKTLVNCIKFSFACRH